MGWRQRRVCPDAPHRKSPARPGSNTSDTGNNVLPHKKRGGKLSGSSSRALPRLGPGSFLRSALPRNAAGASVGWRRLAPRRAEASTRSQRQRRQLVHRNLAAVLVIRGRSVKTRCRCCRPASCPVSVCWRAAWLPWGRAPQDPGLHPARARGRCWRSGDRPSYLSGPRREGPRSAAEWSSPLETKFLRFETRQEQDSVLSRSPAFACNVCPRRPAIRAAGTTRFRPVPLRGCGARSR